MKEDAMSRSRLLGKWILGALVLAAAAARPAAAQQEPCGVSALCLGAGRYQFIVFWEDPVRGNEVAHPVSLGDSSGYFWFFDPGNVELTVKALDGCAETGHEWIFIAGMTNMKVRVRATDVLTGIHEEYDNLQGSIYQPVADTTSFASCSAGPAVSVAGAWSGTFDSADVADCDSNVPAQASFAQDGLSVTGTLDAPGDACGPNRVKFVGTIDGDTLQGTVQGFAYGFVGSYPYRNAHASGTISGSSLDLVIVNGEGLIPGGFLHLHR
jgi:hypothetical protein